MVTGVDVQHVAPCRPDPLGRHGDEPEDEGLDAAGRLQPEPPDADPLQDGLVEVADQGGEGEEGGVFRHGRLGEPAPAEAVAHVVEDALLAAAQVVELHDVHCRGPEVVGEYAAVGVLALPEVGLSVNAPLPLDDEAVGLALPFLHEDGVDFVRDAVDLHLLPPPQREDAGVERLAAVGPDVEVRAVPLDFGHYLLGTRPAVGAEAPDADSPGLEPREDAVQGVLLAEAHVGVAVAVLDIDNPVANDINTGSVAEELLVRRFCIILLCLNELMIKVNIAFLNFLQLVSRNQSVYKQCVEFVRCVEIIGLALVGSIGDVILCQLPDGSEDGIRTACAQGWMIREMAHQMRCHILHARAATEVHAHQRTDNLAELITDDAASLAQRLIAMTGKHSRKLS